MATIEQTTIEEALHKLGRSYFDPQRWPNGVPPEVVRKRLKELRIHVKALTDGADSVVVSCPSCHGAIGVALAHGEALTSRGRA